MILGTNGIIGDVYAKTYTTQGSYPANPPANAITGTPSDRTFSFRAATDNLVPAYCDASPGYAVNWLVVWIREQGESNYQTKEREIYCQTHASTACGD